VFDTVAFRILYDDIAHAACRVERGGDRIAEAAEELLFGADLRTVDHDADIPGFVVAFGLLHYIFDEKHFSGDIYTLKTISRKQGKLFDQSLSFAEDQRSGHEDARMGRERNDVVHHVGYRMRCDFTP